MLFPMHHHSPTRESRVCRTSAIIATTARPRIFLLAADCGTNNAFAFGGAQPTWPTLQTKPAECECVGMHSVARFAGGWSGR